MMRSSIINTLTAAVILLLCAACVGVVIGIAVASPDHYLITWFAQIDAAGVASLFGVIVLVTLMLRLVIAYYVSDPLHAVRRDIFALANSDMQHAFSHHERNDEFGEVAKTLHQCREIMAQAHDAEAKRAAILEQGAKRKEQLEVHILDFESRVQEVAQVVSDSAQTLHMVAEALVNAVLLSQRQAGQMRDAIKQSSQQIAAIASDSNMIHHSVTDIVESVQLASEVSNSALKQTKNASASTEELTEATKKISGVIQLIRKITEKINLLALNAGIESVRAGEAGKGFAVVAQEVKTLATQTKRATEDIVDNITSLQECTSNTDALLGNASQGMDKVASGNDTLLEKIKGQHKLTNNIAYNMQSATTIIKDVTGGIDHIHEHIADVDSASKNVTSAARQLNAQSSVLSQEVQRFLRDIQVSANASANVAIYDGVESDDAA